MLNFEFKNPKIIFGKTMKLLKFLENPEKQKNISALRRKAY